MWKILKRSMDKKLWLFAIKNADCILVMKDGDVIESGNHEEFMSKGGFYCDLHNSQFESA